MHKSNCKILSFTAKKSQPNSIFCLSIKSKQKPFGLTQQKQEQQSQPQNQQQQIRYFPIQEYKNFLKGQRIYLECYYKDKLLSSGYEPYIEAMSGEVMKRLAPSTTVIVTNQMTYEKYQKLKVRMAKACRPGIVIVSILWIEEIYRQKRKVQKQPYLFDEQTDIADWRQHQAVQQDQPMQEYFEREVFKKDFINDLDQYLKNYDEDIKFKLAQNRKIKKQDLNNPCTLWIMPQKFSVFENQDEEQNYKQIAKTYKNPKLNNQKNDKKRQQKLGQQVHKRNTVFIGQKQKRRRTSNRRSQRIQIQNKLETKKQTNIVKKKDEQQKNTLDQKQEKQQSDSQFLRRIRQKKQNVQQQSINTILDKYLNMSDIRIEKQEKRLTQIQQLVSAENYSNQLIGVQEIQMLKNKHEPQSDDDPDAKQNSQSGNQSKQQNQSYGSKLGSYTKSSKKMKPQQQRKSVIFTQQKRNQNYHSQNGPKTQLYTKTKSLGKSQNPKRQKRLSQLMNQFKTDIDQFLQKIGYIRNSAELYKKNKNSKSLNKHQKIIYNAVIKQPYIISKVNDFNTSVKEKISIEKQVFYNIIDFQIWNKHLTKMPILKFFINFRDMTEQIMGKQQKSKKIEIIKDLFQYDQVTEQEAISHYEIMCQLVTSEDYCDLDFYFLCNKKSKESVLMGYLSKIEKKNVLDYTILKSIYDLLAKKQTDLKQASQTNLSFTISMIQDTNSVNSKQSSLRQKIEKHILPNHRIRARLSAQIITGKKITCLSIKLAKNVEFITKKLKAIFISLQLYMSTQSVDIVINEKKSFSKVKNIWHPDYQTFVNSLIVIE